MEPGQFLTRLLEDTLLLQNAHNFLSGNSNSFVLAVDGRKIQLILLPNTSSAKTGALQPVSAEDVLHRIMSRWKNHEVLLEVTEGNKCEFHGTKNAIERHKSELADSSQNTYIELTQEEIAALEKTALESIKVIRLDRRAIQTKAPPKPTESHPVTFQATRTDLVFARMMGQVINRVIQAKEKESRKIDTERRTETRKKEVKAEELKQLVVKKEINKQELRKEIVKNEIKKG